MKALDLQRCQLDERLAHLTDAYIEKLIDRNMFEERKNALLLCRKDLEERKTLLVQQDRSYAERLNYILELAGATYLPYKSGFPEEQRILLETVTSNRSVCKENVEITLAEPFLGIANREKTVEGGLNGLLPEYISYLAEKLTDLQMLNYENCYEQLTLRSLILA